MPQNCAEASSCVPQPVQNAATVVGALPFAAVVTVGDAAPAAEALGTGCVRCCGSAWPATPLPEEPLVDVTSPAERLLSR